MAKVRIQARSADSEDPVDSESKSKSPSYHHQHSRHVGALDILARVWKREGFVGWYQVTTMHVRGMVSLLTSLRRECKPKS